MKTTLYLIRHAQSQGNASRDQGLGRLPKTELGSDLTELGIQQANELADELQAVEFTALYSSHLQRAHHTAQILRKDRKSIINVDDQLREREKDEENDQDAITRFTGRLEQLVSAHAGYTLAVVSHGFVIRGFLAHLGIKALDEMPHGYVQNTGYIQFEIENENYTVVSYRKVG